MQIKIRQTCRLCGEKTLTPVVNLGEQYLATFFVSKENENVAPTRKVPLELVRCNPQLNEKACGLVQLKHSYPPELMYAEYWYLSGVNQTMENAFFSKSIFLDYVYAKVTFPTFQYSLGKTIIVIYGHYYN